ncbi:MAG: molybdenum cofactor guanylyltransferase [Planctomycetota bacterium]|nr:molybdenum cofactor guanylyltransferase [Planctomycetota bacterium]
MRVGGIILCGGKSSRMGLSKVTLPFGPEQMLHRVLRLLGEVVQPLVVVAAPHQQLPDLPPEVLVARDRREDRGPLEGLYAGLQMLRERVDAAYATSCDVPLLVPAFVRRELELIEEHAVVVPVEGQFHHPLAAVYRAGVLPHLETLLNADRLRPIFLYDAVDTLRVPVEQFRSVDPQLHTLANLNRPADYFAALRAAGYEPPEETVRALTGTSQADGKEYNTKLLTSLGGAAR